MLSYQFAITREDYVNYYTYVMWDAPENKKKRNFYYAKQLLPIVFFFLAFYYTGLFDRNSLFILVIAGFLLLTSLMSLFGVRTNMQKQAERVASNPANSQIFLMTTLMVSESGLSVKDELTELKYQWKAFVKKQESAHYYFLFVNAMQAVIIPKRIFSSTEDRLQFDKLLEQHLSLEAEIGHLVKS